MTHRIAMSLCILRNERHGMLQLADLPRELAYTLDHQLPVANAHAQQFIDRRIQTAGVVMADRHNGFYFGR